MGSNRTPMRMILMMVATLVCAAIIVTAAAAGALLLLPSSVFAQQQEETSLGERGDLGSGIASDVLDSVGVEEDEQEEENDGAAATGDDTNTQIAVPIITQDQREANLAEQLGLNVDIVEEEEEVTPTPTPTPVQDTTPPVLTVPEDIVVEATSTDGAVVSFEVTAQDNVDGTATLDENGLTQDYVGGDITILCDPTSRSTFPIGSTTVRCTATDEAGNTATESFRVTVQDTTPPTLIVPADPVLGSFDPEGSQVTYLALARDNVDGGATLMANNELSQDDDIGGDITISCEPPSGSVFPIGTTEVDCTATDEAGNTATESFTITLQEI